MLPRNWKRSILLLIILFSEASGAFVGINIGTDMSNLPPASVIVSILKDKQIKHVCIFDADHQMLNALANTGIEVMVGIPNNQLLKIGESRTEAASWVNKNVASFVPATNITYIAVGNEVLTTIPNAALVLVPAMQFLQSALLAANLSLQVKVSSPQSLEMMPMPFPPSIAAFNSTWNLIMTQFLQFLKNTGSSFMLNAQTYFVYNKANGIFPIEYALFRPLPPSKQIVDPNTNFYYSNMFDALVDSAYYSMKALNFSDIPVLVTATGWPSLGGDNEPDATADNAFVYNSNLILRVLNGSGTPSQPTVPVNTYIHELFNEDLQPGPVSGKNWGILFPNKTAIYSLVFGHAVGIDVNSSSVLLGMFCVVNSSADSSSLKQGLDWACGPGGANCTAIQPGQPCYESNNLVAIASYAYNDYYHRTQANGGTCNFAGTAMITTVDPSHGSCIFAGSLGSNTSTGGGTVPGSTFGPVEMVHSKRLNVQKLPIRGTARKVLYDNETRTLLMLRTGLDDASFSSDICRIDPLSGKVLSYYPCDPGETAKCMQLIKVGNEQVLVVGTSQSTGWTIMPSGEPESSRGRLLVFSLDNAQSSSDSSSLVFCSNSSQPSKIASPLHQIATYSTEQLSTSSLCSSPDDSSYDGIKLEEMEAGCLRLVFDTSLQGSVLSVCSYLDRYVLASSGNTLHVFGFLNENPRRLRKFAMAKTRFAITCLATHFTRIAVGDCRDGILFFSYQEDLRKLEHLYSDPVQRLVADCTLMDLDTAVVSDRRGIISILSSTNHLEGTESPERNLMLSCSYYMGETVMSIQKGSFSYKLPVDDVLNSCDGTGTVFESLYNSIVASTLLGSVLILIPITSEEHQLLEAVQDKLAVHPLTSPILGNDHKEFRRRGSPAGVPTILDGDMLAQFLELTSMQQEAVLASSSLPSSGASPSDPQCSPISLNQVIRLLERVHYALN